MTASLYQSRSFPDSVSPLGACTSIARWSMREGSGEVFELLLGALVATEPEDMRRADVWIQLDVVARPMPQVARVGEQVVDLEGLPARDPKLIEVEVDPARLRMLPIEIDDYQYRVGTLASDLAVADELVVVAAVEAQVPVEVQRGVVTPGHVDASDEIPQSVGAIEVAVLDLVLFGVEVLFASWLARLVL